MKWLKDILIEALGAVSLDDHDEMMETVHYHGIEDGYRAAESEVQQAHDMVKRIAAERDAAAADASCAYEAVLSLRLQVETLVHRAYPPITPGSH